MGSPGFLAGNFCIINRKYSEITVTTIYGEVMSALNE